MNPTSHRMSFSFSYCYFISTLKLKTLGRKANHLMVLKIWISQLECVAVTLYLLCPLNLQLSQCPVPLALVWPLHQVQGTGHRRSRKSQTLQYSGQWKVAFQVHFKAALTIMLLRSQLQFHRAPGEPFPWPFSGTQPLLSIVDGY